MMLPAKRRRGIKEAVDFLYRLLTELLGFAPIGIME